MAKVARVLAGLASAWFLLASVAPAAADTIRLPLSQLTPEPVAFLRGANTSLVLKVPIPQRWSITRARLQFAYTNSTALMQKRSRLTIRLDGLPLAQVDLRPEAPEGEVELALPATMLRSGYRDLEFWAAQNHTEQCGDPDAPELWTALDLKRSYLTLEYRPQPVPLRLSALADFVFDPRLPAAPQVHLALEDLEPATMRLAALAASGVALRYQYRPVLITADSQLRPGVDNVAIGSRAYLERLLQPYGVESPKLQLAIQHLPQPRTADRPPQVDSANALITLTGANPKEALEAAVMLATLSFPWPDAAQSGVQHVELPKITRYSGRQLLTPGEKYLLRDLGFSTSTRRGFKPAGMEFALRLPADFLPSPTHYMNLVLHVAYGGGMREDSVLNIHVNGQYQAAIPLSDPRGGSFQGYQVAIPSESFRRGRNTVGLTPSLVPSRTERCSYFNTENLYLTLFDDSRLEVPQVKHWLEMPRLDLLWEDGFPLTRLPDWHDATVMLTDSSHQSAAAALNLVAMFAQKTGVPPLAIRFSRAPGLETGGETLVLGSLGSLPVEVLKAAGLGGSLGYPLNLEPAGRKEELSWLNQLRGQPPQASPASPEARAVTELVLAGRRMLLAQFQAPKGGESSVTLVTAGNVHDLLSGCQSLWEPAMQSQIRGGLTLVDLIPPGYPSASQPGKAYFVGSLGSLPLLDHLLHTHPWWMAMAMATVVVLMALALLYILRVRRARQAAGESDGHA